MCHLHVAEPIARYVQLNAFFYNCQHHFMNSRINLTLLCKSNYKVRFTIGDQIGKKRRVAFGEYARFILGRPLPDVQHFAQDVSSLQINWDHMNTFQLFYIL